jgi:peptidoglycan/LPS O-acetylase OafA/YrhL
MSSVVGARRIAHLDALRGIAVLGVIFFHIYRGGAFWMWSFVDLFFVLSGFLITDIILTGYRHTPHFLRNFWMRRILRIWPVYFLVLITVLAFAALRALLSAHHSFGYDGIAQSFVFLQFTDLYFQPRPVPEVVGSFVPWFSHSWSLAVEEQFYVVWPLVVIACGGRPRVLAPLCVALIALSIGLRTADVAGFLLLTRLDGLALGALLALGLRADAGLPLRFDGRLFTAALALAAPLLGLYLVEGYSGALGAVPPDVDYHPALAAAFALLYFGIVGLVLTAAAPRLRRLLEARALVWLGGLSYAMYMFHVPLLNVMRGIGRRLDLFGPEIWNLLAIPVIVLAAYLSQRFLEQPILRFKHRFPVRGGALPGAPVPAPPAPARSA